MKILATYEDGSRTVQYEPGDRVLFVKDANGGGFLGAEQGETGTVIHGARPDDKYPSTAFLDVQTDERNGTIHVAPWDVTLAE